MDFIYFVFHEYSVLSCGYRCLFYYFLFFKLGAYSLLSLPSGHIEWKEYNELKHTSVFVEIDDITELKNFPPQYLKLQSIAYANLKRAWRTK